MAAQLAGIVSRKILKESAETRFGQEDPYFETVPATDLFGRQKTKKKRKAAPNGISPNDERVLTKVKRRAYRLDLCLCNFCGIRFGWSSVIGLVPAVGDALDMFMALMVVTTCNKIDGGLPSSLRLRMLFNIVIDFFIGLIPFIGDLADAVYKCNTRNAVLLEQLLKKRGEENLKRTDLPLHEPAPIDENHGRRPTTEGPGRRPSPPRNDSPVRPQPARVHTGNSSSGNPAPSAGRNREPDIEMGRM
ncbi:hypothetical protein AJ78_02063 [Emergomyces pasteurianus Ep9510]|uniref:PH domain-containing protein n=1 Tax=Emergomyces pasteurianus Ep9510 TaxID=1447872 RepID=A0A1J9QCE1_9EURO|nr:hypothetical protein AJ78_02063 [Emergomyces pasteurianus Ep9510]